MRDDESGCGTSKAPGCIKAIIGNPVLIKACNEGIPANGKPVPDGAAFAKIEWAKVRDPQSPSLTMRSACRTQLFGHRAFLV